MGLLNTLVLRDGDRWVDWSAGTCSFDTQEFKDLLELCARTEEEDGGSYATDRLYIDLWDDAYLMTPVSLGSLSDLVWYDALCGGPEHLMADYHDYLNENGIFASDTDADGNRIPGALVSHWLSYTETAREEGRFGFQPLAADAIFGIVEGGGYAAYPGSPSQSGRGSSISLGSPVGMSSACRNKEGAWAFLRQYLLPGGGGEISYFGFPINRADFEKQLSPKWFKDAGGEYVLDREGRRIEDVTSIMTLPNTADPEVPVAVVLYATTPNELQMERFMELYNSIQPTRELDTELFLIIQEEAEACFAGGQSVEEAAGKIQNRASLYVNEHR